MSNTEQATDQQAKANINTYAKYAANVFVAKCTEKHEKGETIVLTTKYGKEHDCVVFNYLGTKDGFFLYSIVREDGFDYKEFCKKKAERWQSWADSNEKKSTEYWEASKEGRDFLILGEPIKIGHHSENRHRNLIKRNNDRMRKSIEYTDKANAQESKADYWERKADKINLSLPASVEYYEYKLEKEKLIHEGLKNGSIPRAHSYSLTYAKKAVNEAENNYKLALRLWGE